MSQDDLVVVHVFPNRFEADLAKSALDAADIESMISSDDYGGVQPGLWLSRGVELLVREEDVQRAEEVLGGTAHPA